MSMDFDALRLAWTDLETTGLTVDGGGILEVACVITNRNLEDLGRFRVVVNPGEAVLGGMNDFVTDMHTQNGLLEEVRASKIDVEEADLLFAEFLKNYHNGFPKNVILAGNTLAGVDIPFLREFMPLSDSEMHYRYLDVTSLRIAGGIWNGKDPEYMKKSTHRAMDDIEECIEEFTELGYSLFKEF